MSTINGAFCPSFMPAPNVESPNAQALIKKLKPQKHPEGGLFPRSIAIPCEYPILSSRAMAAQSNDPPTQKMTNPPDQHVQPYMIS